MSSTYDFDYSGTIGEANSCKKAIIVIAFFTYLIYLGIQGAIQFLQFKQRDEKLIKIFKDFKLEIEQRNYYFLVFLMLTQILTPLPFPTVMAYLYFFITFPMVFLGYYNPEKFTMIRKIGVALQVLILFILFLIVLIDAWYRQLFFRYTTRF